MVAFPVSSSRGSLSRDHSPAITPGSPGPSRLSKSDVANYLNFASHLDLHPRKEHDLAWKLSHPTRTRREVNPAIIQPEPEAGAGVDLADVESENEVDHQSTSPGKPRRVDGPSFAPSYQDDQGSIHKNKKRKRDVSEDKERDSVRWPITMKELDKQNQKDGGTAVDSLEDTIKSFVISYIRSNGLKSPYSINKRGSVEGEESLSNEILDPDLEQEIESTLPDDLVNSAKDFLNRLLVNLAILRPADIGKKRRQMDTTDWLGVLGAATLDKDFQPLTRSANERLREMYKVDEHDLHTHRLNILNPSKTATDDTLLDSLYSTVLPRKNLAIRPHQSQQELEKRAEKRRIKEESRLAKQSTIKKPSNGPSTKAKRKKKQKQK